MAFQGRPFLPSPDRRRDDERRVLVMEVDCDRRQGEYRRSGPDRRRPRRRHGRSLRARKEAVIGWLGKNCKGNWCVVAGKTVSYAGREHYRVVFGIKEDLKAFTTWRETRRAQ
ncbi:MAG: hypothetical protein V3R66_07075 [Rhodospirillales bacterium]